MTAMGGHGWCMCTGNSRGVRETTSNYQWISIYEVTMMQLCTRWKRTEKSHETRYASSSRMWKKCTVYPKKYAHGFCFAVLCCGYTLTDFPISIRLTSLALWQSNDCPSASKATLMNMDKYFMWIHYERLHNHNKAKHNKTVCYLLWNYFMCILLYMLMCMLLSATSTHFKWELMLYCLHCPTLNTVFLLLLLLLVLLLLVCTFLGIYCISKYSTHTHTMGMFAFSTSKVCFLPAYYIAVFNKNVWGLLQLTSTIDFESDGWLFTFTLLRKLDIYYTFFRRQSPTSMRVSLVYSNIFR